MKGRVIALGQHFNRDVAALMVDGQLEDLFIDPGDAVAFAPGAVLRGVVDRLVKGQGGVFLRLPDGAKAFLRDKGGYQEGQRVLVQVNGVAEPSKAIPVTARILFRGVFVIVTPQAPGVNISRRIKDDVTRDTLSRIGQEALAGRPFGLIFRSVTETADLDEISAELKELLALAQAVMHDLDGPPELLLDAPDPAESAWRDWADPAPDEVDDSADALEHSGAAAALDDLLSTGFDLREGGSAFIESTRALIAVDVNTGADTGLATGLRANIALARDLPRQLRLRGLGGQIVIDFAPMPKRDRGTVEQVLRAAFRNDGAETNLVGWTAMGLFELTRKRDRVPLAQLVEGTM